MSLHGIDKYIEGGGDPLNDGEYEWMYEIYTTNDNSFLKEAFEEHPQIKNIFFDYDYSTKFGRLCDTALVDTSEKLLEENYNADIEYIHNSVEENYKNIANSNEIYTLTGIFNKAQNLMKEYIKYQNFLSIEDFQETFGFDVLPYNTDFVEKWNNDKESVEKGNFIIKNKDNTYTAIDNTNDNCCTEDFKTIRGAISYLKGSNDLEKIKKIENNEKSNELSIPNNIEKEIPHIEKFLSEINKNIQKNKVQKLKAIFFKNGLDINEDKTEELINYIEKDYIIYETPEIIIKNKKIYLDDKTNQVIFEPNKLLNLGKHILEYNIKANEKDLYRDPVMGIDYTEDIDKKIMKWENTMEQYDNYQQILANKSDKANYIYGRLVFKTEEEVKNYHNRYKSSNNKELAITKTLEEPTHVFENNILIPLKENMEKLKLIFNKEGVGINYLETSNLIYNIENNPLGIKNEKENYDFYPKIVIKDEKIYIDDSEKLKLYSPNELLDLAKEILNQKLEKEENSFGMYDTKEQIEFARNRLSDYEEDIKLYSRYEQILADHSDKANYAVGWTLKDLKESGLNLVKENNHTYWDGLNKFNIIIFKTEEEAKNYHNYHTSSNNTVLAITKTFEEPTFKFDKKNNKFIPINQEKNNPEKQIKNISELKNNFQNNVEKTLLENPATQKNILNKKLTENLSKEQINNVENAAVNTAENYKKENLNFNDNQNLSENSKKSGRK